MVAKSLGPQKPRHIDGYTVDQVSACHQTLLTLVANLGPWRDCVCVIGGMVPLLLLDETRETASRYVPTMDVDLVLDLDLLANVEAYRRLETNLEEHGFVRYENHDNRQVNYRWIRRVDGGATVIVDLLCEGDEKPGSALGVTKGVAALRIPGAHLAIRDNVIVEITGELLDGGGVTTECVKVAGVIPYVVLKSYAYAERKEEKDAHDLIYILSEYEGGPDAVAELYARRLEEWLDEPMVAGAVLLLRTHFGTDEHGEGHRKNGCVSYARFHLTPGHHEQEPRLRRDAAAVIDRFLARLGEST